MTLTAKLYRRGKWQGEEDGSESVVDVYEVVTASETETISNVLAATGLPARGDSHAEKASAIYNGDGSADHDGEVLTRWLVECKFTTKVQTRENGPYNAHRTKGGMRSGFKMIPAWYDSRGYPLVNTAGDLYEGLQRKRRLRIVNCTHNFTAIPNWFFEFADTVNSTAVDILGKTYPPGCCMLTDIDFPDEPERDPDGQLYWPTTYRIEIDPDGYYIVLPNRGLNEYVFQKRASTSEEFADCSKSEYDAVGTANLKRKIKRRIQTDEGQDVPDNVWLNGDGQAVRVISLSPTALGAGSITAGSTSLTLTSGSFDAVLHKNALIRIIGAGPNFQPFTTQIVSCSGTSATLAAPARHTVTSQPVWMSGALCNYYTLEDLADWNAASIPLPNNHPGA